MAIRCWGSGRYIGELTTRLDPSTLARAYRTMYASRRFDDQEIALKHRNRVYFQLSSAGHEAIAFAVALVVRPGVDWLYPHVRDRALCLHLGMTAYDQFLASVAAADDEISGARQMPSHFAFRRLNMPSRSSCIGMQFLQAVGVAEAGRRAASIPEANIPQTAGGLVFVGAGEGATSEGEFWESLNTACNLKLPVLYVIEDNGYAISVPVEVQTAGGSISRLVAGFPNLHIEQCDGTDLEASHAAVARAAAHCRQGLGPALVHAHVTRPYSHSLSDDEAQYRTAEELAAQAARDPIVRLRERLRTEGVLSEAEVERIHTEVDAEIIEAAERALRQPHARPESALDFVYSPDVDPTSARFDAETAGAESETGLTMVETINQTLRDEMARDPRVLVFGQDVADASRADALTQVKGKGGVFKATAGLQREFGDARVFNTPLAEANIIGRAVGMAVRGFKPIPEIQFLDYIWPAYMQLHNEVPLIRWRSNNAWKCPMVVRVPAGGYIRGGAVYHSQSGAPLFTHIPGWRVVMPATARDACGLLRTAIRADDPVLFLEHKHLYRQPYNRGEYPGPDFLIPFAKARVVRAGSDATLVTYGALVHKAVAAAGALAQRGVEVEVIDLRTLSPYDWTSVAASVRKTNRVLVAYEDSISWGYGAEIAARIASELFDALDAPVGRVAARDAFVSYTPEVEDFTLPQTADIIRALEALAAY
ncbi:MAG: dehydrogenase E1 component subunit alpha/beta [Acidobacteria bacterium]|nr:dehydrogenase E1 component subunit alpha/beta [Acidobacteriota bacterium]